MQNQVMTDATNVMSQPTQQPPEGLIATNPVYSNEILESIQSIAKVMQQQLLFSSKTAKQGINQNANLFQEMIKAQEKKRLGENHQTDHNVWTGYPEWKTYVINQDIHSDRS